MLNSSWVLCLFLGISTIYWQYVYDLSQGGNQIRSSGSARSRFAHGNWVWPALPALTQILHRITCVNNDIWQWRCLRWCKHITSRHFKKSHCWCRGSTKKSDKIALWVQVACTATALAVLHSWIVLWVRPGCDSDATRFN